MIIEGFDLVLILGFQRYYIDQLKDFDYSEQMQKLEIFIKSRNNYIITINYAFTPEEYNTLGGGLPECITGTQPTHIPHVLINRARTIGGVSICHRKSKDIFSNSNPNLDFIVSDIVRQLKENHNKVFTNVHIFSLTHDYDDIGLLITGLENHFEKDVKVSIY